MRLSVASDWTAARFVTITGACREIRMQMSMRPDANSSKNFAYQSKRLKKKPLTASVWGYLPFMWRLMLQSVLVNTKRASYTNNPRLCFPWVVSPAAYLSGFILTPITRLWRCCSWGFHLLFCVHKWVPPIISKAWWEHFGVVSGEF